MDLIRDDTAMWLLRNDAKVEVDTYDCDDTPNVEYD